jgi:hypothetical protein
MVFLPLTRGFSLGTAVLSEQNCSLLSFVVPTKLSQALRAFFKTTENSDTKYDPISSRRCSEIS